MGKTFLIKSFFASKDCVFFYVSGIQNAKARVQLEEFKKAVEAAFYSQFKATQLETPKNWMAAFEMLTEAIQHFSQDRKAVLFFDELPWMAIRKTQLLQALDYYWNRHWSSMPQVKLMICGSAASWIIRNVLNARGGLHNRVTLRLPIEPFNLRETRAYLESRGVLYDPAQIVELYLCVGGIPHYLKLMEPGLSAVQNINALCFQKAGTLMDEFDNLFASLFKHAEVHEKIIRLIATKREGMARLEIEKTIGFKGGDLSLKLQELEQAGFILPYIPWGHSRGTYFKIIDEYSLFYLSFIQPASKEQFLRDSRSQYWEALSQTPTWQAWSGYAFEALCFKHIPQIRRALHIPEGATASSWKYIAKKRGLLHGAQIDLVFDRPDGMVNLCEIKYCKDKFKLDASYAHTLTQKASVYQKVTGTTKQILISFIVSNGLQEPAALKGFAHSVAMLSDFFKPAE